MRSVRSLTLALNFVLAFALLAGCIASNPPQPVVDEPPAPVPAPAVHILDDQDQPVAAAPFPASGNPFDLKGNDWNLFEASITGQPGSWLFLYVPLPAPSPEERWSYEVSAEARGVEGEVVALLTTRIQTATGSDGSDATDHLVRPQAIVSREGLAAYRHAASVTSYVGGDRGTLGFFYAVTANAAWSANLTITRGDGSVPATTVFVETGNGTTVVADPTRTDNLAGLGHDVSYHLESSIASPGWSHFHLLGSKDGPARSQWTAEFPEGLSRSTFLSTIHAPPVTQVRADRGAFVGSNGTFEATLRSQGVFSDPTMAFIHVPGFAPWLPEDFGHYV